MTAEAIPKDGTAGGVASAASDPSAAASRPVVVFHLDVHSWMETQQTSHGVRHDDYAQYHAYCTRRMARLARKPSDAKQYLVHSGKYAPLPSGTGGKPKGGAHRHAFCSRSQDTFGRGGKGDADAGNTSNEGSPEASPRVVPHVNILWYLLVSAERAWAHANELQRARNGRTGGGKAAAAAGKEGGGNNNNNNNRRHQPVLRKLRRAHEWATLLLDMAEASADRSTQLECHAYRSWTAANYALEKMEYQAASEGYARAMTLCYELSTLEEEEQDDDDETTTTARRLERHGLFVTRADTVLRPLFRYCQYELKQAGRPTMEEPRPTDRGAQLPLQQQAPGAAGPEQEEAIVFRGRELVLDSKELRVLLLKLQSMEQEDDSGAAAAAASAKSTSATAPVDVAGLQPAAAEQTNETQFLTALSVLDDALEVVQSLQQGLASVSSSSSSGGSAVQAKLQQYALWKGYLQYCKTRKVMEHTEGLLVAGTGMSPAERVHVYDSLLAHAKSLLNLPRPGRDEGSGAAAEEDDEFALQVQANILRLRAHKTYHMGWAYYRPPINKYSNALALMEHSAQLRARALEEIAACDEDMPHSEEFMRGMKDLPVASAVGAIRAAMMLQQRKQARKMKAAGGGGTAAAVAGALQEPLATDRPLLLRLYEYDSGIPEAPIADLRPMPLPCKPVFYDLAYDHAMDPAGGVGRLEAYVREHTVSSLDEEEGKDSEAGAGSSSFFGWLTSGSKK